MCGRYSFAIEDALIKERFGVSVRSSVYKARYNCAPSQELAVISSDSPDILSFYQWGLIPFWAKDRTIGNKMINARAETILEKPSFGNAFKRRRCLVLCDGFYEWKKMTTKVPYRIIMKDASPFAMAGIWDKWKDPEGNPVHSFSIITARANTLMEKIHDRMPVILSKEDEKIWLSETPEQKLTQLLRPYPSEEMKLYQVSTKVNSPFNDFPELLLESSEL